MCHRKSEGLSAFTGKTLGSLIRDDIEEFLKSFETMNITPTRKTQFLKVGLVPLEWAYKKRLIDDNIGAGLTMFSSKDVEIAIHTPKIAKSLFTKIWIDDQARLANILVMVIGICAGE